MQKRQKNIIISLVLFLCLLVVSSLKAQEAAAEGQAVITNPIDREQLFGLVQIIGSAVHPTLFDGYSLDWSNAQNSDALWIPVQPRVNQQVVDSVLGQWDTVALGIPDGTYQLRLQMFLSDGTVLESFVNNLVLVNSSPTDVPTVVPVQAVPTLSESGASSLIEQPPTLTPLPTFESLIDGANATDSTNTEATFFNFSAAQGAFCSGAYFSMFLFGIVIAYLMMRKQISPYTRRLWWQIRAELKDDQGDY